MPIPDLAGFLTLDLQDGDAAPVVEGDTSPPGALPLASWDLAQKRFWETAPPRLIQVVLLPVGTDTWAPRPEFRVCAGPTLALRPTTASDPDRGGVVLLLTAQSDAWWNVLVAPGTLRSWVPATVDDGRNPDTAPFDAFVVSTRTLNLGYMRPEQWRPFFWMAFDPGAANITLGGSRATDLLRVSVKDATRMSEPGTVGPLANVRRSGTANVEARSPSGRVAGFRVHRLSGETEYGGPANADPVAERIMLYGWMIQDVSQAADTSDHFFACESL